MQKNGKKKRYNKNKCNICAFCFILAACVIRYCMPYSMKKEGFRPLFCYPYLRGFLIFACAAITIPRAVVNLRKIPHLKQ